MDQKLLSELISKGLVKNVRVDECLPSKGKALLSPNIKHVWTVTVTLVNGSESQLLSTRGSSREWASLDRLTEWLRSVGLSSYQVTHMEVER